MFNTQLVVISTSSRRIIFRTQFYFIFSQQYLNLFVENCDRLRIGWPPVVARTTLKHTSAIAKIIYYYSCSMGCKRILFRFMSSMKVNLISTI